MSGCLICQRPDICSTTSLESIRTSTSAVGSRSSAACRPATRPPYSATLLVARPTDAARSASTRPVVGVPHQRAVAGRARVAPRPAVRLDDEARLTRRPVATWPTARHSPDSAVRTRIRPQFSQRSTSCGSALRTAASSLPYSSIRQPWQARWRSGAAPERAGLRADAVVQGQQRRGDPGGHLGPGGLVPGGAVGDVGQGVVAQLLGALAVGLRLLQPLPGRRRAPSRRPPGAP